MSSQQRVVITDSEFGDADVERPILERAGLSLAVASCRSVSDVVAAAADAEALLVQYAPISSTVFDALPKLRVVVRYGTGLDNVDLDAAERAGVRVRGITDYCTHEVADHTMALLLSITRGLTGSYAPTWNPPTDLSALRTLRDATLGLIGFGRIGRAVAERALAFGMDVGAYDPHVAAAEIVDAGVSPLAIEDAFRRDVVSLHLSLGATTRQLVDGTLLALMPRGSILLNVSRGGLVDEAALLAGLRDDRPWFAGLDVLDEEPPDAAHPLLTHPRTLVTPHIAFSSATATLRLRQLAAETAVELLTTDRMGAELAT